jgi:AcrR family transcriptional regulator
MGTRDRIIEASLVLFNDQGERNVTTNHIAAHLGISPGNLYYHFKNKQAIIFELFTRYEARVMDVLQLPEERGISTSDKLRYLVETFKGLWEYRFMHRDMESLLSVDPSLHGRYREFFRHCLARIYQILLALNHAGIMRITEDEAEDLALSIWIIVTSWFSFLHCNLMTGDTQGISQEMLLSGIYQVFSLERPYITAEHKEEVLAAQREFLTRPTWLKI